MCGELMIYKTIMLYNETPIAEAHWEMADDDSMTDTRKALKAMAVEEYLMELLKFHLMVLEEE